MTHSLEKLCTILQHEVDRQHMVLAASTELRKALLSLDPDAIDTQVQAQVRAIEESAAAEPERLAVLREIVDGLGLPVEAQTLTGLIRRVQDPWKARLAELQARLNSVLTETQAIVRANQRMLRASLGVVNRQLEIMLPGTIRKDAAYMPTGRESQITLRQPALLDARG